VELEDKIHHVTYTTGKHETHARVELYNGFVFNCSSPYVGLQSNAFGERYAYIEALRILKVCEGYMQAELDFIKKLKETT
jgi:hypothetical protein